MADRIRAGVIAVGSVGAVQSCASFEGITRAAPTAAAVLESSLSRTWVDVAA